MGWEDDWLEAAYEDRASMSEQLDDDVEFLENYDKFYGYDQEEES